MEAYDTNKQTTWIASKSKIKSRAQYVPEPAQCKNKLNNMDKVITRTQTVGIGNAEEIEEVLPGGQGGGLKVKSCE